MVKDNRKARDASSIIEEYRTMAPGYDVGSEQCGWDAPRVLAQTLHEMDVIKPGTKILDFAAGTGALTNAFRRSNADKKLHITAMDISPDMLKICGDKNIADSLIEQDITKPWAIAEISPDIVAATGVGEYLSDESLARAIENASHALKPSGVFAFTFLPATDDDANIQHMHEPGRVRKLLEENGLAVRNEKEFDAYRSEDGHTIRHVLVVAEKMSMDPG